MEYLKSVSSQTVWQVLGKAVTSLSTILVLGAVTRTFGETGTGIFTLTLAYLAFFYLAADFGLNTYILPEFLKENFSLEWQKLLGLRLTFSLGLFIIAVLIALLWPGLADAFRWSVITGAGAIFGASTLTTCSAAFQSKLRFDLNSIATGAGAIFTLVLIYLLISLKTDVSNLMLAHMLGWLFCGGLALFFVKKFVSISPIFDFSFIKNLIKGSWPFSLTIILNLVYFRVDAFLLTNFKGFADVGLYNVAYSVFQSVLVLPAFIMNSFYPLMLKDYALSKDKFVNNLLLMGAIMFGIAFAGTVLTLILSPWIILLIAGGGFAGSSTALQLLSLSFPAFFVSSILMYTLITMKQYKAILGIYVTGLLVNIILNLIFIPAYSYVGASIVTGISEYFIVVLQIMVLIILRQNFQKQPAPATITE